MGLPDAASAPLGKPGSTRSAGLPAAAAPNPLRHPAAVSDLFLYRLTWLANTARIPIVRLCRRDHGITRRELRLLGALAAGQGVSSSALAGRMQLDRARTSRVLTSLVGKGLVQRQVAPADRRETVLQLSPQGRAVLDDLLPKVAAINRDLLADIDDADLAVIDRVLRQLSDKARAMGGAAAAEGEAWDDDA